MTVKGDWGKDVEVELTSTVYDYSLRIYETPYATDYNFYTLAHDDIYRNSSATDTNCYNQPPHVSWYMNDAIEGSQYTTQPAANVKLVANKYTPKAFDEALLPAGGSGTSSGSELFSDIKGHWGKTYIEKMNKAGVINGYDDGTFRPDGTVTKGEFVTLIAQALKLETKDEKGHWAAKFVTAAKAANIIDENIAVASVSDLDTPISREEMASMVAKAAVYKKIDVSAGAEAGFIDESDIAAWSAADVKNAVALGIINGFDTDKGLTFQPKANATRAQAATILSQLWDLF